MDFRDIIILALGLVALGLATLSAWLFYTINQADLRLKRFAQSLGGMHCHTIWWAGADGLYEPGMRNILVSGEPGTRVIIAFDLGLPFAKEEGFRMFGDHMISDKGTLVISTYMGKGSCLFRIIGSRSIMAHDSEDAQRHRPDAVHPPYPWQRIGFYG